MLVPYRRLAVWCAFAIATDLMSLVAAKAIGNNLWMAYFTRPVEVGLLLWILVPWQPTEMLKLGYTLAIPIMVTLVASLLMLTDPARTFHQWIAPFLGLMALVGSLHTLLHRSLVSRSPLPQQDWFWICLGFTLFWTGYTTIPVFASQFVNTHVDWVLTAYMVRSYADILAFMLMSWGILLSRRRAWAPGS